ncbi:ester cyclase [Kribbella shirazensis]|uniref:Putative ester cyclase n=1 Tax=Kribbella shirazensis TaxID=1105143 RepID=A0A7X5V5Y9_9ACTN|nr:ester cyclase [Kribbella shirazensis]NIK55228.1 putative ester cyclase [Kribbella shirazensis]
MSTTTRAGDIAVRSILIMADGERSDFDAVIHPDARNREDVVGPADGRGRGPAAYYATAQWLRGAFEGLSYEIHHVIADGNLVAVNSTMKGRHVAPFVTYADDGAVDTVFPPTRKEFAVTQSHWFRIEDGQVVDHWANRDDLGQAKQLGWVPPTPAYLFRMARAKSRAKRPVA